MNWLFGDTVGMKIRVRDDDVAAVVWSIDLFYRRWSLGGWSCLLKEGLYSCLGRLKTRRRRINKGKVKENKHKQGDGDGQGSRRSLGGHPDCLLGRGCRVLGGWLTGTRKVGRCRVL